MSVSFVDGGKSFFECNQAEARKAIDYISKLRENVEVCSEAEKIKQKIRQILNARGKAEVRGMVIHGDMRAKNISDAFRVIEEGDHRVTHLLMSAKIYSGLRCWDRDTIEIETNMALLKAAKFGSMWGADICVSRECESDGPHSLIVASIEDFVEPVYNEYKITFLPPEQIGEAKQDVVIKQLETLIRQIRNS
jgi:hypothetical protein